MFHSSLQLRSARPLSQGRRVSLLHHRGKPDKVCEYFVHTECQDFAMADCKENATYLPGKDLAAVKHTHHWREGNLPSNSKCAVCKKNCFSAECLSGFRCEWCGITITDNGIILFVLEVCKLV
ncbi:hypothetical protein M0802_016767 [Mischocyttarus mexicanus]|nr:hypothetical protein M0802_016767 [Mischocyttarus mexicanus]